MKVNPLIVFRKEFDGTALLFDPETGDSFGLNKTSVFIWEQLEKGLDKEAILCAMGEEMDLPPSAAGDLDEFIGVLMQKGFLSA